ncbi:MAG: sortase [Rubrobacteraceae bacterium]
MSVKRFIPSFISLLMIGAGVGLIVFFFLGFFGQTAGSTATNNKNPQGFNVPKVSTVEQTQDAPGAKGPKNKTLTVTIPAMSRVKDASVPDAVGSNEEALNNSVAIHLKGTGFPWQKGSNTYLAGHRLGYMGTKSLLAFFDLNKLKNGDKIYVKDANGKKYTYEVFKEFVVSPNNLSITKPVSGKSVLTLQTCTLPDYTKRLIVQAKLTRKA